MNNNEMDVYLNTNEMINDYAFIYQIIMVEQPMDFEAVSQTA